MSFVDLYNAAPSTDMTSTVKKVYNTHEVNNGALVTSIEVNSEQKIVSSYTGKKLNNRLISQTITPKLPNGASYEEKINIFTGPAGKERKVQCTELLDGGKSRIDSYFRGPQGKELLFYSNFFNRDGVLKTKQLWTKRAGESFCHYSHDYVTKKTQHFNHDGELIKNEAPLVYPSEATEFICFTKLKPLVHVWSQLPPLVTCSFVQHVNTLNPHNCLQYRYKYAKNGNQHLFKAALVHDLTDYVLLSIQLRKNGSVCSVTFDLTLLINGSHHYEFIGPPGSETIVKPPSLQPQQPPVVGEKRARESDPSPEGICSICLTAKSNVAYFGCGHLCMCSGCLSSISDRRRCPICRKLSDPKVLFIS